MSWREQEKWHPILVAQEGPTGKWRMLGPNGETAGTIEIRRRNTEVTYRVEHRGQLLGWANSLKLASHRLYMAVIDEGGRHGPPKAGWGGTPWHERNPE
jgi:hypothetical protein